MALAVFDVDGTLVGGPSTEKRLFAHLLRRGWLKPRQLAAFLRFGFGHMPAHGWQTWKKNKAYLVGLPCEELQALVAGWVRTASPDWWFVPSVQRLRQHQQAGDTVVLLTGTPQFMADALASELGVSRAIGTECASEGGRFRDAAPLRHPFDTGKLALVQALCAELAAPASSVFAYADSGHDLPLLRFVGHPIAVRPDRTLRVAAQSAGWEILGKR